MCVRGVKGVDISFFQRILRCKDLQSLWQGILEGDCWFFWGIVVDVIRDVDRLSCDDRVGSVSSESGRIEGLEQHVPGVHDGIIIGIRVIILEKMFGRGRQTQMTTCLAEEKMSRGV